MSKPVNITVAIDQDSNECLYKEGVAWESTGEITVYVTDLVAASGGEPILLKHVEVNLGFCGETDWPEKLEDLLELSNSTP